jgi:hypothetical protein
MARETLLLVVHVEGVPSRDGYERERLELITVISAAECV